MILLIYIRFGAWEERRLKRALHLINFMAIRKFGMNGGIVTNARFMRTLISEAEKLFTKSSSTGAAASSIAGLQLTAVNYSVALKLKEQFAQEQTIINAHMDALLKLKGTTSTSEVNKIREAYDGIQLQIRGLQALGVKWEQYGTLLIPIIMSKIPGVMLDFKSTNQ